LQKVGAAKGRSPNEAAFLGKHTSTTFGPLKVHEVTGGVIEGILVKKEALGLDGEPELSPKSGTGRLMTAFGGAASRTWFLDEILVPFQYSSTCSRTMTFSIV